MAEIWKDVVGYEGLYQVSNEGNVKSVDRIIKQKSRYGTFFERFYKGKKLKQFTDKDGYKLVDLSKQDGGKLQRINRLVAFAFIPNPDNKPMVDHINTNRADNRVENLRWVSGKENASNEKTLENKSEAMIGKMAGEKHPFFGKKRPEHSKLMSEPIIQINKETGDSIEWESTKKCALELGCSEAHLINAVNGKNRKKGHEFKGCLWYKKWSGYNTSINNNTIVAPRIIV